MSIKVILLLCIVLFHSVTLADCGCEDRVYMEVTYKDRNDGVIKVETVIGQWWPIHYLSQPYSSDPVKNKMMSELESEELLMNRISDGDSYKVVRKHETLPIKTKLNGIIRFPFLIIQGVTLSHSNVESIIKISEIKIGCTAWRRIVSAELKDLLLLHQPVIIEESDDPAGGESTYYKLKYDLGDEPTIIYFFYGYDGCA